MSFPFKGDGNLALYKDTTESEIRANRIKCRHFSTGKSFQEEPKLLNRVLNFWRGNVVTPDLTLPVCLEPAWSSGRIPRWKELLKFHFGGYYIVFDDKQVLRLYKGSKVTI